MTGPVLAAQMSASTLLILDTRLNSQAASSNFVIETRPWDGATDSSNSGTFTLDARTTAPIGLVITGPSSVIGGGQAAYSIQNAGVNVSLQSTLGFNHAPVTYAGIGGNTLFTYPVSTPQIVQLVATYRGPGGQVRSAPFTVSILPESALSATATVELTAVNGPIYTISGSASGSGGLPPYNFNWDADFDGHFDDYTGTSVSFPITSTGGTIRVRVEVVDAAGARVMVSRLVVLDKPPSVNQPPRLKPFGDVGSGEVLDKQGNALSFDSARINNGLVVITHGLWSNAEEEWVQDMANRIETRFAAEGKPPPNIILYEWRNDADPVDGADDFTIDLIEVLEGLDTLLSLEKAAKAGLKPFLGEAAQAVFVPGAADVARQSETMLDIGYVRPLTQANGIYLAAWIWNQAEVGLVNPAKPIHLIGHSAGGFCMGECAYWLLNKPLPGGQQIIVDRVTMLDTPLPYPHHLSELPPQTKVEQIVSSIYGAQDWPSNFALVPDQVDYHYWTLPGFSGRYQTGDSGHGLAHVWYRRTIYPMGEWNGDELDSYGEGGFNLSPLLINAGGGTNTLSFYAEEGNSGGTPFNPAEVEPPHASLPGFDTFGTVSVSGSQYTITEASSAGIVQNLTLPAGVQMLAFEYRFQTAGDGDFLSVRFGSGPELFLGMDTVLSRNGFSPVRVPLEGRGGVSGQLVFELVSLGAANTVILVRIIEILEADDPDGDGLTTTQELVAGSNPAAFDSDEDGLGDKIELQTYFTNPMLPDTDGDGSNDSAEVIAGTSPTNGQSFFRVTDAVKNTNGTMLLHSPSQAGRLYNVQRSTDVTFATYEVINQGQVATPPQNTHVDNSAGASPGGHYFYRIEVYQP